MALTTYVVKDIFHRVAQGREDSLRIRSEIIWECLIRTSPQHPLPASSARCTRGIAQEKTPTQTSWGFDIGGAGGDRTRVRKSST